jgi:pyruvate,orthophosphate dikinase
MSDKNNICVLDYLVGTLATAYKGMITSLVIKDFCIAEKDGLTALTGSIIAVPQGRYQICLLHDGVTIAREELQDGYFALNVESPVIEKARNLQLDIVQNGKHIGTFLLKKESQGGVYVSAVEISRDLQGINFKVLGESVADKTRLREKAESIISAVFSTKKKWEILSEDINTFSKDLFWYARDVFYLWQNLFIRFLMRAWENVEDSSKKRALSNFVSLIELPLDKEEDISRLKSFTENWIRESLTTRIIFFQQLSHILGAVKLIFQRLPDLDVGHLLKMLLTSLKREIQYVPVLKEQVVNLLGGYLGESRVSQLRIYSEKAIEDVSREIETTENLMAAGAPVSEILGSIESFDIRVLDSSEMVESFFRVMQDNVKDIDDRSFQSILPEIHRLLKRLSSEIHTFFTINTLSLLKNLLNANRMESCNNLIGILAETELRDGIFLNKDTAEFILRSDNPQLIRSYTHVLKKILVPSPNISGFSSDTWAERVNPLHFKRLSGFFSVLTIDSDYLREVLIHLICNLYVSGVFIPDDTLFQREISAYLNASVMQKNFLLHYMLLKKLPVYFNEVGASGRIRDLSTEIDSWGNDATLYFLRKQLHVNASNNNIPLIEGIIRSWVFNDFSFLSSRVPDDVKTSFQVKLLEGYSSVIKPLFENIGVLAGDEIKFETLITMNEEFIKNHFPKGAAHEEINRKIILLITLYREVVNKYAFLSVQSNGYSQFNEGFQELVKDLKNLKAVYISREKTQPEESLYFKRHIAFGIPSVIGSYHEAKFDALAETFRKEEAVRLLLEKMIDEVESKRSNPQTDDFRAWFSCLEPLYDIFCLLDMKNFQVAEVISIIKANKLHISQVFDLLKIWQRELTWIVELFYRTFHNPLSDILGAYRPEHLPDFLKRLVSNSGDFVNKASDVVIRNMINSITGVEELDRLLNSLIKSLFFALKTQGDIEISLSGRDVSGENWVVLQEITPHDASILGPLIGSKAKNLVYLKDLGLRVPYAVIFSSGISRSYEQYIESPDFKSELKKAVRVIEDKTGSFFGKKKNPLFLSVRSGSYISMPGILSSILYCGMNKDTVQGFSEVTHDPWLAWDSYRRFIEHYASIVIGMDISMFEDFQKEIMRNYGLKELQGFDTEGMIGLVHRYLKLLNSKGYEIPDDVHEQLRQSVKAIYRSWFLEKAQQYKEAMNVSNHWGTSVTIMQMIYGNKKGSGASVFFTRNPQSMEKGIYGEIRESATGDDIVYGRFTNRPLACVQSPKGDSLEESDTELFTSFRKISEKIEISMGEIPQEVETAYIKNDGQRVIYVLQTKRMEFQRGFTKKFHAVCRMESSIIGRGVGMNGGALSGVITFSVDPEHIRALKNEAGQPVILIRKETSTEDVAAMPEIDGIITAIGGVTSHAAILSQKFGITAVIGCSDVKFMTDEQGSSYALIGTYEVREGFPLSMDGSAGLVYSGVCDITIKHRGF